MANHAFRNPDAKTRPMLDQAMTTVTVVFSTRRGELAEIITNAGDNSSSGDAARSASAGGGCGGSTAGSLDDLDGIVVVGGDGTFFEVCFFLVYIYIYVAAMLRRRFVGGVDFRRGTGAWWLLVGRTKNGEESRDSQDHVS